MIFFILIAIILGLGMIIFKKNNSMSSQTPPTAFTTIVPPSIPTVFPSITDMPRNENGFYTNMVDGLIKNIYTEESFSIDMFVNVDKIFDDKKLAPTLKKIVTLSDTKYTLYDKKNNVETEIDPSLFQKNDQVIVFILEANTDINKVNTLTATKITKFKNL